MRARSSAALAVAICLSLPVAFLSLPAVMRFSNSSLKVLASPSKPYNPTQTHEQSCEHAEMQGSLTHITAAVSRSSAELF